jgi:hypothetical protein
MVDHGLAALYAFDGKRVAGLRSLVGSNVTDAALLDEMPGAHEIAASWVLKARAEAGGLSEEAKARLYDSLPELSEPDAILHLLQSVQHAPFASPDAIRPFLSHKRTLLRVWAMDAMARVAPADAAALVEAALEDDSAAMRARARALSKNGA